jgi:D-amino-acid dehydrogenase
MQDNPHSVVIGAGVIGIACGISLLEKGHRVTIYDPEPPGSMTSSGNAGGFGFTEVMPMAGPGVSWRVPGWLLDPCGPLFIRPGQLPSLVPWLWRFHRLSKLEHVEKISHALKDILRSSMLDTRELVKKCGLESLFVENGMITVYKSEQGFRRDRLEWDTKKARGIEVIELDSVGIREMEPALENANFGAYTPQWCNTPDPFKFTTSLGKYFCDQGGVIVQSKVKEIRIRDNHASSIISDGTDEIKCGHVIVAAGIWSKLFCNQLDENVLLESERGYNTTLPNPGISLNRQITFGDEKFVITNIQISDQKTGLRIGGAAEFAGITAPANFKRSERLVEIARRYLPELDATGGSEWMGQRPSTPDSLPVISRSGRYKNVYYAFGHSHGGLTMAATTGKLIARLTAGESTPFDLSPFHIRRFQ